MNISVGSAQKLQIATHLPLKTNLYKWCGLPEIIRYKSKYFLAFRTSLSHFAAKKTCLHVMSSNDLSNWKLETTVDLKSDVREPRFFILHEKLFLAFFQLGSNPFAFSPREIFICKKTKQGWTSPINANLPNQAMWRVRTNDNKAYMSTYTTDNIFGNKKINNIFLYQSVDGLSWKQIFTGASNMGMNGPLEANELEFYIDKKDVWGTLRGDVSGHTNFHAHLDNIGSWTKSIKTGFRYDDSTLFKHNKDLYLVSRRSLDGKPDKANRFLPKTFRYSYNMARYSVTKKKLSLFKFDKTSLKFAHILDFPSHGDTGYSSILKIDRNKYLVFGYSNNIHMDRHYSWIMGQLKQTHLYVYPITFS